MGRSSYSMKSYDVKMLELHSSGYDAITNCTLNRVARLANIIGIHIDRLGGSKVSFHLIFLR